MSWLFNVLLAIDQLGNAIAGGNPDVTISARTAYNAMNVKGPINTYWKLMEKIIDFSFYPIHGPNHCRKAYLKDELEFHNHGSDFMRVILSIFIILFCIPITLITHLYSWLGFAGEIHQQ